MFNCYFKSSKEKKSFYQHKKLEMLNYIRDSLERKIASVKASIDVLESQISRDKEVEVTLSLLIWLSRTSIDAVTEAILRSSESLI